MNFLLFLKLSEKDKKLSLVLLLILLFLIVIFGYLQKLVSYIMREQGKQIDNMMYDILKTGTITTKKEFRKEAYRKSMVYFTKKAYIPFLIVIFSILAICIYGWASKDNTMQYYFKGMDDFSFHFNWPTTQFFGLTIVSNWPTISKTPDWSFTIPKYYSLFFSIIGFISFIIYLYQVQAYIARLMRISKLSRKYFSKELINS